MKTNCRWPYHTTDMCTAGGLTIGTTTCSMTVPFDDCNKWGPPPSSLPQPVPKPILPPTATPRFEFNKWPNHSTRDCIARWKTGIFQPADSHWPFNAVSGYFSLSRDFVILTVSKFYSLSLSLSLSSSVFVPFFLPLISLVDAQYWRSMTPS